MNTYVILDKLTGNCKIGKTKNIKSRFSTLSTANLNLKLLIAIPADMEKQLHLQFANCKFKGEWFKLTQEDLELILELYVEYIKDQFE